MLELQVVACPPGGVTVMVSAPVGRDLVETQVGRDEQVEAAQVELELGVRRNAASSATGFVAAGSRRRSIR